METFTLIRWCAWVLAVPMALYGLHRLGLRLEERGLIYYRHRKPSGSSMGSFVAVQRLIEPQAEHVIQVSRTDEHGCEDDEDVPGAGPGPRTAPRVQARFRSPDRGPAE